MSGITMARRLDNYLKTYRKRTVVSQDREDEGERVEDHVGRVRKGGTWLKTTLVTAAWGAARSKDTYLRAQFLRLKSRRGPKKAILAVAASMLTAAYHMLRDAAEYNDLGPHHFERDKAKVISRLVKRLQDLGCEVELKAVA
jgi:hypothetical protein